MSLTATVSDRFLELNFHRTQIEWGGITNPAGEKLNLVSSLIIVAASFSNQAPQSCVTLLTP